MQNQYKIVSTHLSYVTGPYFFVKATGLDVRLTKYYDSHILGGSLLHGAYFIIQYKYIKLIS